MNGPGHYREAERLLSAWQAAIDGLSSNDSDDLAAEVTEGAALAGQTLAAAQAHATLALVAATVDVSLGIPRDTGITGQPSAWRMAVQS